MMTRLIITSALFVAAFYAPVAMSNEFGCPIGEPAQQAADEYNQRWRVALSSDNTDAFAGLYAENAVLMPPTDETIVGRRPIESYLRGEGTHPIDRYTVDIVACEFTGNSLQIAGVWGAEQTDFRGQKSSLTGNVVRILDRQEDGRWETAIEIWN